ncbi:MAG: DUF1523 family protein [Paracoccaceae bacterium]
MITGILKWTFRLTLLGIVAAFLHYTLPQWDTVRVVDTYEQRQNPGVNALFWAQADAGSDQTETVRDVLFVSTIQADGDPMVFRNEDTAWGWPPYFKFDTANLQAQAADAISTAGAPRWVAIKHYGWRAEFLTAYPNALDLKPVSGPDARVIPWTAIVVLVLIVMLIWAVVARWVRFRRARIDPTFDRWDARWDARRERRRAEKAAREV